LRGIQSKVSRVAMPNMSISLWSSNQHEFWKMAFVPERLMKVTIWNAKTFVWDLKPWTWIILQIDSNWWKFKTNRTLWIIHYTNMVWLTTQWKMLDI
jgi:hypothetical protein